MRRAFLPLLLLTCAAPALALDPSRPISQYGHMMWTLQDGGLPGTPTSMAQTADGYLWVGTRNGLVRFDGVRFVPFSPPEGQELRSSRVLSLLGSSDGSLWIGTRWGLQRWHRGHLTAYEDARGQINSILENESGKIWFSRIGVPPGDTQGPLCEASGDHALCHGDAAGVPIPDIKDLNRDAHGNLWAVSTTELVRWRDGVARTWVPVGLTDFKLSDVLQSVATARDGTTWVGAVQPSRGLGLLRLEGDELRAFVAPGLDGRKLSVGQLVIDRENMLWMGTQSEGVYRLHAGKVSQFRRADGLSSDTVQALFEDREGTIWIITTQGIDAFRDLRVASVSSREGLSADLANAVLAAADGTVWINAWHSLDAWRDGKMTSLDASNGLPGEEATAMFQDREGMLWIGIDRDLTVFEDGKFTPIRAPDGSPLGSLTAIAQDSQGDIWVVALRPEMLNRIRDRKVIERIPRSALPYGFGVIAADPREGIWLALTDGRIGRYRRGQLDAFDIYSEPRSVASGLVAFPDGTIVASTARGLAGWRDGKTQLLSTANGLPCRETYTLLRDPQDGLWVYAACGVIFIANDQLQQWWKNPQADLSFRLFDALDGAQPARSNFFPKGSVGPDGRIWFANASVVQMIDPQRLGGNPLPPFVQIERLIADRTSFAVDGTARLPPNIRDLQVDYTGLSFVVPQKTRFRYRLTGHDSEWQDVGTRRQAFYTDLPPNEYVFEVHSSNNDGVWSSTAASVAFSIAPAIYQTRTFAVLCVLAAISAVWLLFRLRVRQIEMRMRVRVEERIVERERIARELHDTLLQGLLSASLQLSVANNQIPADAPAKSLVEKILRLLRQVSDEGRDAVRDLRGRDPARDGLERALAQIPKDLGMDAKVQFRLLVEGTAHALRPSMRDEVYRIAREALANAFRHSGASTVETVLVYTPGSFRMVIRDNGCGMDPNILHSGRAGHWGLSGMRERAAKIGARLKVLSAAGAGTEIEMSIAGDIAFEGAIRRRWTDWLGRLYLRTEKS